ncbi:DUF2325 domain-containing protein [Lactobacillus melliventris]|uniref:DUF2325 domain-containing protein n=1 Tax=Lactobacillus melliventris TaxID=1218507 RepID=UPI00164F3B9A|nr:DUF2325 domain-containing protein [Lactobacillus melliventris]MBC6350367.1 DUF2325 domain-containing protein [Lactobacillus melliventris]
MFDYRNNLKRILNQTAGDDKSLKNGIAAIKLILGMTDEQTATVTAKNNIEVDLEQLNLLLTSLARLIKNPGDIASKNTALSAIQKLTLAPNINKKYRQNLVNLKQAINLLQTPKDMIDKKVFEEALEIPQKSKRDYRKGKRYTVIRLLSGCDLVNDSNRRVYTMKESQIHSLNLKSGDIVEAVPEDKNSHYEATILRVVGFRELPSMEVDSISTFKYAVVQGRAGHLAITRNAQGKKLRVNGKAVLLPVDSSKYWDENIRLVDGSIVDLAWYDGDVRLKKNPKEAIQIRWIYELEQPQKPNSAKKKRSTTAEKDENLTKLALDLHYQRVGIAIGNNQNEAMLEGIVKRYNGIPIPIDAFQGKKKIMENQIKDLDIVILVTAFAAHDSTWNISEFASKYHIKFAVSSSKGYQAFERALYRAEKGLPAYEGNQTINYQVAD